MFLLTAFAVRNRSGDFSGDLVPHMAPIDPFCPHLFSNKNARGRGRGSGQGLVLLEYFACRDWRSRQDSNLQPAE